MLQDKEKQETSPTSDRSQRPKLEVYDSNLDLLSSVRSRREVYDVQEYRHHCFILQVAAGVGIRRVEHGRRLSIY